jgi:hypothetical protein
MRRMVETSILTLAAAAPARIRPVRPAADRVTARAVAPCEPTGALPSRSQNRDDLRGSVCDVAESSPALARRSPGP